MTAAAFVLVEDTDTSTDHKSLLLGQAWETGSLAPSRQDCLTAHRCSPSPFPNPKSPPGPQLQGQGGWIQAVGRCTAAAPKSQPSLCLLRRLFPLTSEGLFLPVRGTLHYITPNPWAAGYPNVCSSFSAQHFSGTHGHGIIIVLQEISSLLQLGNNFAVMSNRPFVRHLFAALQGN